MSKSVVLHIPRYGRLGLTLDRGQANRMISFETNLIATKYSNGIWQGSKDLGSGLTTNMGVLALANDMNWASPATAVNLFKLLKYHATGTGATAAAFTDFKLQTPSGFGGQTPVAGTQVFTPDQVATAQKIVSVATIAYTGTEAVTEWGFFNRSTLGDAAVAADSPFTAVTSLLATGTGTTLTASSATVQGDQQYVLEAQTTARLALILSNTTAAYTIATTPANGWMVSTTGVVGSAPGGTEAFKKRALMWDHKVFAAINVVSGDSIQFTYTLTINSGT